MERKELGHLAIDLIEDALRTPKKSIVLEERIHRPIREPGNRSPTEDELNEYRDRVMDLVVIISESRTYSSRMDYAESNFNKIQYNNGSSISRK